MKGLIFDWLGKYMDKTVNKLEAKVGVKGLSFLQVTGGARQGLIFKPIIKDCY